MIGDALGISHNTVKDWERATSNGPDPRIPGLLEQLEAYLELPRVDCGKEQLNQLN